jgi:hypothetical protein
MTQIISIIASICNLLSGATYFKQVFKEESIPNPATWLIWVVVTILNTLTYFLLSGGNFWISLASGAQAFMILVIFFFSLWKGKFSRLHAIDIICLVLALIIGIFWKISGNFVISNIALQALFTLSFYPTIYGLLTKKAKEKPAPWFFAVGSYSLQIINILLNPVSLFALVFPIVNLLGQGIVGIIALRQRE